MRPTKGKLPQVKRIMLPLALDRNMTFQVVPNITYYILTPLRGNPRGPVHHLYRRSWEADSAEDKLRRQKE